MNDFLNVVAKQRVTLYDGHIWEYYDMGEKKSAPLVCLPDAGGSPLVFHKTILALTCKGYRVLAVQYPVVWTHQEWVHSFDRFLDTLGISTVCVIEMYLYSYLNLSIPKTKVHLYGVSLGAFLAQVSHLVKLYPNIHTNFS